jgi:hypothetical protein
MSIAISILRRRAERSRCLKSASVPSSARIAVWPPSFAPMPQGLPTSSGSPIGTLFFPFLLVRPMGWIGGRYTTLKPIDAMSSRRSSTSTKVPCFPGVAPAERGKSSYQELKRARSRSTNAGNGPDSQAPSRAAWLRASVKSRSSRARLRSFAGSRSARSCWASPGQRIALEVLGARRRGRDQLRAHLGGEAQVVGVDAPLELLAPGGEVVDPAGDAELPEPEPIRGESRAPNVVAERFHLDRDPCAFARAAVAQLARDLLVPVREAVGGDLDLVAHHALHREAAAIHARAHVLDHRGGREILLQRLARVVHDLASGSSTTTASGGSVSRTDCSRPCHATGSDSTRPRLPTPLPP